MLLPKVEGKGGDGAGAGGRQETSLTRQPAERSQATLEDSCGVYLLQLIVFPFFPAIETVSSGR